MLIFGDDKGAVGAGAVGTLIGEENRGLEYMFIMMNAARFQVGMQGIAISDRAYQKAVEHAKERVQSRAVEGSSGPVSIIHHPDVRRMLMFMRSNTEAARAVAYVAAGYNDIAHHHPDPQRRAAAMAAYEYLVPIVKGWSTEMSIDVTSTGVQVHGGMGFIEGNRRGAVLPRRAHSDDLRRHDSYPGERSGRPQDGARWRRDGAGIYCSRCARPPPRQARWKCGVAGDRQEASGGDRCVRDRGGLHRGRIQDRYSGRVCRVRFHT